MGKTGWQVTAAICASLSVMLGALAWNSSRALEVANAELRSTRVAAPIATVDLAVPIERAATIESEYPLANHTDQNKLRVIKQLEADGMRCIRGQMFEPVPGGGWNQIGLCPRMSYE